MTAGRIAQPPLNTNLFGNAQPTGPSPPEAYLYGKGAYASPISQTPPSANISPTNLHSSQPNANVRQLRQPRQPLYTPAALRPTNPFAKPTDIPSRPRAPDTPPTSKENSFDSGSSNPTASLEFSPAAISQQQDDMDILRRGLSRAASDSLDEELGDVNGMPTTAHWKPDISSPDCAVCHQAFTWFFRRHHCRRCGDVVCETHSSRRVPLDQNARYHPHGTLSRACDPCYAEWTIVKKLRHSRASSLSGSQTSSQGTTMPALPIPNQPRATEEARVGSMARSEGMVWSTF
ncbi:hypothetical protein M433DRAFT_145763 [Acidomyces richmondensis BFW]|nr:MAG: hypothetical protein FE78DRAFT_82826 [Acidomyces sp. 'richmondensis']KYG43534.1 hypothetical protein M433DRAFT_145763 [Acidomyces richmondensis BFW]